MWPTISALLAMQFNVLLLATWPYIIVGGRTDFSGAWGRIGYSFLILAEVGAICAGPFMGWHADITLLKIVGVVDAALVLMGLIWYHVDLNDRRLLAVCTVDSSLIKHILGNKKVKPMGYVPPHRFKPVIDITQNEYPAFEKFVETLNTKGCYVIHIEPAAAHDADQQFLDTILSIQSNIGRKLNTWTAGAIRRPNGFDHFAVFSDHNDATEVRLSCT